MSIDTPQRILVHAEQRFAELGYAGTSLSGIAQAAGLGNAGLLHHFPSKKALYRAVLEDIATDLDTRNDAALKAADDPIEQLRGLVEALVGLHHERPTALMIISQEFLDRSGRIDTAGVLPLARVVTDTIDVVEAGQREGSIRDGDPVAMTAALHGALLHGALGQAVYARTADRPPADRWKQQVAHSALASVLSRR